MKKSFVVIGLGKFGSSVARKLAELKQDVIAIDKEERFVNEISDIVTEAIVLDATDEKALKNLEIEDVDAAIVGVGEIEESILITLHLKDMGIKNVIAKAVSEQHKVVLEKIGATKIILPEKEVGETLALSLVSPAIFERIEMSEKYAIVEIMPHPKWIDSTLKKADIRNKYGVSVVGIKRRFPNIDEKGEVNQIEDIIIAPPSNTKILKDDVLIVLGDKENIEKLKKI